MDCAMKSAEVEIDEEQYGFRKDNSFADQILVVRQLCGMWSFTVLVRRNYNIIQYFFKIMKPLLVVLKQRFKWLMRKKGFL